jgi:DNA invertase Pin-like site-specific DNA recombinase
MKIGYIGILPYTKRADKKKTNQELLFSCCDEVITEKASWISKSMTLNSVIASLEPNTELVICSLKFIARDTEELISRIELIESKGASLTVLDMTSTLSGYFTALKEFQKYMSGAQIVKGKNKSNKPQGRKPIDRDIVLSITYEKKYSSNLNVSEIARRHGISRRSVNRILNNGEKQNE